MRDDLADKVPTQSGVDEAEHQHLVTYAVALGVTGTLDPSVDDPLAAGFSWPKIVSDTSTTVDDLWHAAYNGRGKFLSVKAQGELTTSLDRAISDIAERTATAAAVSINSAKLTTQSVVYLAEFNTNGWQGNLFAFKIVDLDTGELSVTPEWTAAGMLNSRNIATNPRTIITRVNGQGVPFRWADLNAGKKNDLRTNPAGGTDSDTIAAARLDYLRGDRSNEGSGNCSFVNACRCFPTWSILDRCSSAHPVCAGPTPHRSRMHILIAIRTSRTGLQRHVRVWFTPVPTAA